MTVTSGSRIMMALHRVVTEGGVGEGGGAESEGRQGGQGKEEESQSFQC